MVKRWSEADSAETLDVGVAKDLGGESLDGRGLLPGIERQASFAAGLLQESFPVPTIFEGNLGQQEAASSAIGDDQAVTSDFDCLGMNREETGGLSWNGSDSGSEPSAARLLSLRSALSNSSVVALRCSRRRWRAYRCGGRCV